MNLSGRSKTSKKKTKTYAFIDSQNLNLSVRNDLFKKGKKIYIGWRIDFARFFIYLQAKYGVTNVNFFWNKLERK